MLISVSELISKSIELYKKNLRLFLIYAALILLPTTVVTILNWLLFPELAVQNNIAFDQIMSMDLFGLTLINLISGLISFWVSIAFIQVIANKYKEKKAKKVTEELESATSLLIPAIIVSILTSVAVVLGFILLIIPGIIFSVWFAFSLYEVILDDQRNISALKGSRALVRGRWWGTLWRLVAPVFVFGIVAILLQGVTEFLFGLVSPNQIITDTVVSAIGLVIMPLTTSATTILYIELKRTPVEKKKPHPDPQEKDVVEE